MLFPYKSLNVVLDFSSSFIFYISSVSSFFICLFIFNLFLHFYLFLHFSSVSSSSICFLIFHLFLSCLSVSSYYICSFIFHLFHHFPSVSSFFIDFFIFHLFPLSSHPASSYLCLFFRNFPSRLIIQCE